jgi:ABC-type Na+ efflux pump permease subunit
MYGLWVVIGLTLALLAGLIYLPMARLPGKTLAVAQAAYRETIRQPLFWFLLAFSAFFMLLLVFLQYFTFGEDIKMMKELDLNSILLPTLLLTIFTASITISEEIEGRTAITLMSKPVSRRHYLLGKFFGILAAALLMTVVLSIFMGWVITLKYDWDPQVERPQNYQMPQEIEQFANGMSFLPVWAIQAGAYVLQIFAELQVMAPGVVLNFCQVMILTAVAVALATRLPMVVNLVICLVVFFMGRLTHVLESQAGDNALVKFVAQVFGTIFPGLNFFEVGVPLASDVTVPWGDYVLQAGLHGIIYATIALLFGLILFEDRDLA